MMIDANGPEDEFEDLETGGDGEGEEAATEGEGAPEQEAEDDGELSIEIEGEEPVEETHALRQLREQYRDQARELEQYRKAATPRIPEVGKKPDLWEDYDGDPDKFEAALIDWNNRKHQADTAARDAEEKARVNNMEFQRLTARHEERAAALKIPNFAEYQQTVVDALGPEMAGAALVLADDSAKLVAALGKNPQALARITAEPNPLKQIKMLLQVEAKIVTTKKKPPAPEASTITRSTASLALSGGDKKLEALEKEADRTGDRSKLIAYKASKRAA